MKAIHLYLLLHVFSTVAVLVNTFDPVTTTVFVGLGATLGRTIWNYLHESCDSKWISYNATGEHLRNLYMLVLALWKCICLNATNVFKCC